MPTSDDDRIPLSSFAQALALCNAGIITRAEMTAILREREGLPPLPATADVG